MGSGASNGLGEMPVKPGMTEAQARNDGSVVLNGKRIGVFVIFGLFASWQGAIRRKLLDDCLLAITLDLLHRKAYICGL